MAGRAAAPGPAASKQDLGGTPRSCPQCSGARGAKASSRASRTWRMGAKQAPSQEDRAAQGPCPQRHRRCSHRHCLPGHQRAPNGCVSRAGGPAGRTTRTGLLTSLSTSPNPLPAIHPQPEHPRAKSRAPRSQEGSIVVPSAHSGRLLILPAGLGVWARGGGISGPWGTGGTHPPAHESRPDGSCASQGAGHTPGVSSQQLLLPNSSHPTPSPTTSHVLLLLSAQTSGGPTAPSWRVESYHPPPLRDTAQPNQVELGEQATLAA